MALTGLQDLASLGALFDGAIDQKFKAGLKAVLSDLDDRATTEKGRKVTVSVECVPKANDNGDLEEVSLVVEVKTSVPAHRTWAIQAIPNVEEGRFVFNELSPENPHQLTLDGLVGKACADFNRDPPVEGAKLVAGAGPDTEEGTAENVQEGWWSTPSGCAIGKVVEEYVDSVFQELFFQKGRVWVKRTDAIPGHILERLDELYLKGIGRKATTEELQELLTFCAESTHVRSQQPKKKGVAKPAGPKKKRRPQSRCIGRRRAAGVQVVKTE